VHGTRATQEFTTTNRETSLALDGDGLDRSKWSRVVLPIHLRSTSCSCALWVPQNFTSKMTATQSYYQVAVMFLQCTSTPEACWILSSLGIRYAQDVGAHRRRAGKPTVERELWKRAFWCLYILDVFVSAFMGRPRATSADEWVYVKLPLTWYNYSFRFLQLRRGLAYRMRWWILGDGGSWTGVQAASWEAIVYVRLEYICETVGHYEYRTADDSKSLNFLFLPVLNRSHSMLYVGQISGQLWVCQGQNGTRKLFRN